MYAEVQQPHVYLQNSHMELSSLYLGVPTKSSIVLINGTLLPTRFRWGKVTELAEQKLQLLAKEMHVAPPPEWPPSKIKVQPPSQSLLLHPQLAAEHGSLSCSSCLTFHDPVFRKF